MTKVYGPLRRTYRSRSLGLVRGKAAQRHHARHETAIWGRFAGPDKSVYLIGHGEAPPRLGRGIAERLHGAAHTREGITDRNQPGALTLHDLFSHAPQTRQGHP